MAYTLHGSLISPYVRKVAVVLLEKGVAYEHRDVNPFSPPEGYRALSPLGKIPVFTHDERPINDSSVIARYIDRLHPEPALYPADPYACARAEWIEEYMDGGFGPKMGPGVFIPMVLRPLMTGEEPDEAEPRRVVAEELPEYFDYMESQIGESGHFVGDGLTIADLAVGCLLVNMRLAGFNPDAARWPRLADFTRAMHARESFRTVNDPVIAAVGKRWVPFD